MSVVCPVPFASIRTEPWPSKQAASSFGPQVQNAVPFAYLDTRHSCRAVEASKPYPVQTVKNGIWLRMPPLVALELQLYSIVKLPKLLKAFALPAHVLQAFERIRSLYPLVHLRIINGPLALMILQVNIRTSIK